MDDATWNATMGHKNATFYNDTYYDQNSDAIQAELTGIWYYRILMAVSVNSYINFMENDTISETTQQTISNYYSNYTFTYQDLDSDAPLSIFYDVLADLMKSTTDNARYIMALCGMTFICLATMNLIQSWPRDRFQWASIMSRYAMGCVMILLLVLNVGKYQTFFIPEGIPFSQRAAFLNWIEAAWVLPTLALAYAIQFLIDTGIVYAAVWFSRKSKPVEGQVEKNM
ncbi:hypothetical protein BDV93DRAFT_551859 [Ceratobasidium sp. AG-I]|nr:hypothetical protein BDV93DRAFT_551859 [Ceratobasidium sp. AG-I]